MHAIDEVTRRRVDICKLLLAIRAAHRANFPAARGTSGTKLAPWNGYFEILLELYVAELEVRQVYQSWLAPTEPAPSTHRKAARLEEMGAVVRSPDASDRRRLILVLTPAMRAAIGSFVDSVEAAGTKCFARSG